MKVKIFCILILLISTGIDMSGQLRNFYHRLDVGSGNVYTFVGSNLITAYANYFTHDVLFDNSFNYTIFSGKDNFENVKTKPENLLGIGARDLFNDVFAGLKLGYKSDNFGNFNWGIYGSFHYKLNQFRSRWSGSHDYNQERFSYIKPGVGIYGLIGNIEQKIKCQIELGLQYCLPMAYKGSFGNQTNVLNNGFASHYAIKLGGATDFSCGVYADFYHFDIYKRDFCKSFKMYNIGVTFTITPRRGERYYE